MEACVALLQQETKRGRGNMSPKYECVCGLYPVAIPHSCVSAGVIQGSDVCESLAYAVSVRLCAVSVRLCAVSVRLCACSVRLCVVSMRLYVQ